MYDIKADKDVNAVIDKNEAKIHENLKKKKILSVKLTDFFARLGIKFNAEFKSILDFDDDDTHPEDASIAENISDKDELLAKQDGGSDKRKSL